MAGTRRRSDALVPDDDDVAFLPAHDPSGVMPDPRLAPSPSTTTTTLTREKPAGGLSVTQVCGGALAAVTAAVAASYLGVGGTLSRAARVSRTLVVRQTLAPAAPDPQPQVAEPPGEPAPEPHPVRESIWQRIRWKPVLLVAGGVFVVAMAVISVSELVLGHPIANAGESGTTLSNLGGSSSSSTSPASTPTGTGTPSPSDVPTPTTSGSSSTDASPDPSATSPSLAPNTTAPTDPTTGPTPGSATTAPSTATTAPTGAGSSSGG
jgi:hypothetical protein